MDRLACKSSRPRGRTALLAALLLCGAQAGGADELPLRLQGDLGAGVYRTRSIVAGTSNVLDVLPYADLEYGRAFARVDTFGIKTVKMGDGYLELAGRVRQDGFGTQKLLQGVHGRKNSVPLGVGSLQITPVGAFWINAFHDVRASHGNLLEAIYGAELKIARASVYPLLGVEYQSSNYVRHYFGISATEAASSHYAVYQPAGALNELLGVIIDIPLTGEYHLNGYVRRTWLADSIRESPIVNRPYLDTGYLSLSYRFK